MTQKEFIKELETAKKLHHNGSFQESIEIYNLLVPIIENIENVILKKKQRYR